MKNGALFVKAGSRHVTTTPTNVVTGRLIGVMSLILMTGWMGSAHATGLAQSPETQLWDEICQQKMDAEGDILGAVQAAERHGYRESSNVTVPREITITLEKAKSKITLGRIITLSGNQSTSICLIDFGLSQSNTEDLFTEYFQVRGYKRYPPEFLWRKENREIRSDVSLRKSEAGTFRLSQHTRSF